MTLHASFLCQALEDKDVRAHLLLQHNAYLPAAILSTLISMDSNSLNLLVSPQSTSIDSTALVMVALHNTWEVLKALQKVCLWNQETTAVSTRDCHLLVVLWLPVRSIRKRVALITHFKLAYCFLIFNDFDLDNTFIHFYLKFFHSCLALARLPEWSFKQVMTIETGEGRF